MRHPVVALRVTETGEILSAARRIPTTGPKQSKWNNRALENTGTRHQPALFPTSMTYRTGTKLCGRVEAKSVTHNLSFARWTAPGMASCLYAPLGSNKVARPSGDSCGESGHNHRGTPLRPAPDSHLLAPRKAF